MNYVFDIDGTLTPARQPIDPLFKKFFLDWIKNRNVYLISGSDYPKSKEQVGDEILHAVNGCFNTAGNVMYVKGKLMYRQDWEAPQELIDLLQSFLNESSYPIRAGNHIEKRIGMINFSIVGRACTLEQRKAYNLYDQEHHERAHLRQIIMEQFPEIEVSIGGQISIDIYPVGKNKSQIISKINGPIHFFGDKTMEGGNDYDLAKELLRPPHKVTQVNNWEETMRILQEL
ncbi:MAG: HAD-IIB family hydrolase [Candidatus Lokiarchaeota archaeon]|nr:HAD-IIB family hydrolase [Candidatus Harpocratesius repetitus]